MPIPLLSTSSIPDELKAEWPLIQVMSAKVLVKRLVQSGMRKGPSELLTLPDYLLEQWYTDEAYRYLQEQKEKRSKPVAVIP